MVGAGANQSCSENAGSVLADTVDTVYNLTGRTDAELHELVSLATQELYRRALERGDLDALIEDCFDNGFTPAGHAREPYLRDGILVCPGSIVEKSATSHDCVFVHVDTDWVWDAPQLLLDSVRKIPDRSRTHQRSVSLLSVVDGFRFEQITSSMRQGVHSMKKAASYLVADGTLELVSARASVAANFSH